MLFPIIMQAVQYFPVLHGPYFAHVPQIAIATDDLAKNMDVGPEG